MFSAPTGTFVSQDLGLAWLLLAAGCSWLTQTMRSKTLVIFCLKNCRFFAKVHSNLQLYEELLKVTSIVTAFLQGL